MVWGCRRECQCACSSITICANCNSSSLKRCPILKNKTYVKTKYNNNNTITLFKTIEYPFLWNIYWKNINIALNKIYDKCGCICFISYKYSENTVHYCYKKYETETFSETGTIFYFKSSHTVFRWFRLFYLHLQDRVKITSTFFNVHGVK